MGAGTFQLAARDGDGAGEIEAIVLQEKIAVQGLPEEILSLREIPFCE